MNWTSRSRRLAWEWPKIGQGAADQIGTPVCPHSPGPGKDVPNQTSDQIDWPNAFQRALPMNNPHLYNDMKAHLQEMLDRGAIWKSHSPWASVEVLVWKKDGSLKLCIDLRKLNNWTLKDAYWYHIGDTFDSLQGSQWFSSPDLKSGYWQVKMDEESKPLTAFTVGLLGFYECDRMPLRLTNTPPTFQW